MRAVRLLAMLALAAAAPAGDEATPEALIRTLRQGSQAAAAAAHVRLLRMGAAAWPHLIPLLEDHDPEVRLRARGLWLAMAREGGAWWGFPAEDARFETGLPSRVIHRATGIEMALVPAGTFAMGPDPEGPKVHVERPFYLGVHEVTQEEYRKGWPDGFLFFSPERARFPVTSMSWNGLQDFLRRTDLRLPSEAEWEYACRAGGGAPGGAWSRANAKEGCRPAGESDPNGFGLCDMLGNAAEWCAGAGADGRRVVRGGSVADLAAQCTPFRRRLVRGDLRSPTIGFRVARDP